MYPSYDQFFYNYSPYQYEGYDERLFGPWSPSQGGLIGRPPGPAPGRPPFTPPGSSGMPPFPLPGQGQQSGPPSAPPPSFIPAQSQQVGVFAVDPGAIRGCLFRYTYVWLTNRQQFWFFPTFVGRRSISGFRWNGFMWVYFGTDLRRIESFQCV